jgi:dihydrofolate synthase/folylpolyglutamate synthase
VDIDSILKPFKRFGVHLGLERMQKLLANLSNPHEQVPIIHVTGTNGKGSVCAYLSSVLTQAGYRTGRYTSPHLVDWTERICLNEQPISSEQLCQLLLKVQAAIDSEDESPTQFEVFTAAAWLYFQEQQVDVAVVEVGLGGRLDATNVCAKPLVTIITSISIDHVEKLGPTIADIAAEKAGILKLGCPSVIGPLPPEAQKVVRSRLLELKCPYIAPQPARQIATGWAEYQEVSPNETSVTAIDESSIIPTPFQSRRVERGNWFTQKPNINIENPKFIRYPLPLQGQFQLTNSALVIAALEILRKQGWQISEEAIVNGMAKTQWLGRMQWTTWNNHKLLLDGAHNPGGAQVLRDYLDSLNAQAKIGTAWVIGMLANTEHSDIFTTLLRPHDRLNLVPVPDHLNAHPSELAKLAQRICPELDFCKTYSDLSSALEAAFAYQAHRVVLCGSLYLVGHFFQITAVN